MSRAITAAAGAALSAPVVPVGLLFQLDFESGPARFWTGLGALEWAGRTFSGLGEVLKLSAIEETAEVASKGVTITLAGLPVESLATLENEAWQNRPASIWLAVFNASGTALQEEPVQIFRGRMDTLAHETGASASYALTLESRLVDLERPRIRRYTNADQQQQYPGDRGFEFVESVASGVEVSW